MGKKKLSPLEVLKELKRGKTVHMPGNPDPDIIEHFGMEVAKKIAKNGLSAKEAEKLIGKRGGFEFEGTVSTKKGGGILGIRGALKPAPPPPGRKTWW
jgi:hypothetical protein